MKGKAVVAVDEKKVEFLDIDVDPIGEWDILVELEFSAISAGTEAYMLSSFKKRGYAHPYVPGYAPVGRVTAAGDKANTLFAVGDRVSYFAPCASRGLDNNCGGHQSPARLDVDPANRDLFGSNTYCVKIPEGLSLERAAFAGISSISCLGISLVKPQVGERAVVIGQGIIGQFAAQHLKLRGAEVAVADLHGKRLALAKQVGADHLIDTGARSLPEAVKCLWSGGADIIVDSTGSYRVVEDSVTAIRTRGRYVFLGWYKGADFNLELFHGRIFEAYFPWTLEGTRVVSSCRLMETGALKVDDLVTHRFKASDAQAAYDLIYRSPDQHVGILLDWRG
jgi:3-hydroxyethyl bacteriochlorophyllide a dehydrogenase